MGRASLLLAVLLAPAVAAAQAVAPTPNPGQITFPDEVSTPTDGFINAEECASGTIRLSWRALLDTGRSAAEITEYQLYAANKTTEGACPTRDGAGDDASLVAGPVGITIEDELTDPMLDVEFATSEIAVAAGKDTCDAVANEEIALCIQARASGADIGTARGRLTLSLTKPGSPTGVSASPGERALNVSWNRVDSTSTTPAAEGYVVDATVVGTTTDAFDPVAIHTSGRITSSDERPDVRLGGLVNGVVYQVRVFAFSTADNRSDFDPANAVTGIPQPVDDFFETYRAAGGVEEGGCASGAAGPVAIGAVALLLAMVVRRRKA